MYPNPNTDHQVHIAVHSGLNSGDHLLIYNVLGQRLMDHAVSGAETGQTITLTHNLPAGLYIVKLQTATKTYTDKLLVW